MNKTYCDALKAAIDAAPDALTTAVLQLLHDQACGGGVSTQDTGGGGPGTNPPPPPKNP